MAIARDNPAQSDNKRHSTNRLLYIEKELQVSTGYLDYVAKIYMLEIDRWVAIAGAAGFVEGSVLGAAAELLGYCYKGTKMQIVRSSCREYIEMLQNGQTNIQSMPIYCGKITLDKEDIVPV